MTYLGYEVYNVLPWREPAPVIGVRNDYILIGKELQKQTKVSHELSEFELQFHYVQETLAARAALRTWFDTQKGRNGRFWVPSWKRDYQLRATLPSGSGQINVQTAYRVSAFRGYNCHLYFNDPVAPWCAKITAVAYANGEDIISFLPSATTQVTVGSTIQICDLYFCRLDMDALRIETVPDSTWTEAVLHFRELQKETP